MTVRLVEDDIFSGVSATSSGASAVIDFDAATTISCQLIFEVSSPVGASITYQGSNVGGLVDLDWTDIRTVTITVDGTDLFTDGSYPYRFFRANKALSSGSVNVQGRVLVTGDATSSSSLLAPLTSGPITDLTNDVSASGPGSVAATVNSVGGSTAAAIHTSVLATVAATAVNTVSTIVKRDGSGNFAANIITANLTGTASNATAVGGITITGTPSVGYVPTATSSTTATWQAGGGGSGITALTGDVTASGTGSVAATVALVGGSSAADVHTSQLATAAATASNTVSTIVKRDGSGNFAAGTITLSSLTASTVPYLDASKILTSSAVTPTELGYVSGVTSAIQTQLNAKASTALTSAHILVGDGSNFAADVAVSGDLTLANTGAFTIANSAVTNAKISASAAIDFSKLAALASGNILVGSAGNVATSVTMSGDATIIASGALTIANSAITNAKLATVSTATFKGRTTAGTGNVEDLTATQATALLNAMVGDSGSGGTKGLVPAPASGDAAANKFLKADGTWTAPGAASGTVTSVAQTVPAFLSVAGSPVTTSGTLALSLSGTALPATSGGTGVTSIPTSASASNFAAWDASVNIPANNFAAGYTTTATAGGTTTLTVASTRIQYFTGSSAQTVILPVTSTLTLGHQFEIVNLSSGAITVQSSGGNTIAQTLNSVNQRVTYTCILTSGTTAASWNANGQVSTIAGGTNSQIALFGGNYKLVAASVGINSNVNSLPTNSYVAAYSGQSSLNANYFMPLLTTTATAAGTTTLDSTSNQYQRFTGSTTQTVKLASTANPGQVGYTSEIWNYSTGALTIQTSSAAALQTMAANTYAKFTVNSTANNNAASWDVLYLPISTTISGTGNQVLATSPALTTPQITGITSGSAIGAGLVGEVISSTGVGAGITIGTTPTRLATITLTAGLYLVTSSVNAAITGAATNHWTYATGTTDNSFTGTVSGYDQFNVYTLAADGLSSGSFTKTVNVSGSTPIYLNVQSTQGSAASGDFKGSLIAVRIA